MGLTDYKDIWVYVETFEDKPKNVGLELLGQARKLADKLGEQVGAVVIAGNGEEAQKSAIAHGADIVYVVEGDAYTYFDAETHSHALVRLIEKYRPSSVFIGATNNGRDLGSRTAVKVHTGLTADCTGLAVDEESGNIAYTRPAFGGNLMATIVTPKTRPQMATVRPGVMDRLEKRQDAKGELINITPCLCAEDIQVEVLEVVKAAKDLVSLTDAAIICSGGRGLGGPEGFRLIEALAEKTGGVVGASRAAVDAGWIHQSHQVGQTGTTVKPNIYFACGISGAIQHLAGMQTSDIIIAINKDPDAPMMQLADYAVCGDLKKVIPEIIAQWDQ